MEEAISFAEYLWCLDCFGCQQAESNDAGQPIADEEYCSVDDDEGLEFPVCHGCGKDLRKESR